jgi:hypothetical protein
VGSGERLHLGSTPVLSAIYLPDLKDWRKTSEESRSYNCIAWAADDDTRVWWPPVGGVAGGTYWPPSVRQDRTVAAFVEAFGLLGYQPCDSGDSEPGLEKVAIYASELGVTHTARQLPNGGWTSKLGRDIDITHATVGDLEHGLYGVVVQYVCRPVFAIRLRRTAPDSAS